MLRALWLPCSNITAGLSPSATAADVDVSIEELLHAAAAVEPVFAERKRVQHSLIAPQVGQSVVCGRRESRYSVREGGLRLRR